MLSSNSIVSTAEADDIEFHLDSPDNSQLENRVVCPCGRFESFDYKGNHFEVDWDEMVGDEDEEEIPHEQLMAELDRYIEDLLIRPGTVR